MPSGAVANSGPEIRDIKGLLALYGWYRPLEIFLIVLAVGVLGYFLWRVFRNRTPKPVPLSPPPVPRPADVVALEKLAYLRDLAGAADPKPFHFGLSEVLREYLESRFQFPATDRTLEEIRHLLPRCSELDSAGRESVITILKHTDQVKFTDYRPSLETAVAQLDSALELVRRTRPPHPAEGTSK